MYADDITDLIRKYPLQTSSSSKETHRKQKHQVPRRDRIATYDRGPDCVHDPPPTYFNDVYRTDCFGYRFVYRVDLRYPLFVCRFSPLFIFPLSLLLIVQRKYCSLSRHSVGIELTG